MDSLLLGVQVANLRLNGTSEKSAPAVVAAAVACSTTAAVVAAVVVAVYSGRNG